MSKQYNTKLQERLENWKKGMDVRAEVIAKLADPDAVGGQIERWWKESAALSERLQDGLVL